MNKRLLIFLLLPLLLLNACSGADETKGDDASPQESGSAESVTETKEEQDSEPYDTYGGEFEAIAHQENLGTVKTGPLTIDVVVSNLVKGTVTDSFILDEVGKENIDYINIGMEIDTTDEDIHFSGDHLKLKIDTGESFEYPHDFMSDKVEMKYIKENYTRSRMVVYMLDESKVEDVGSATLLIKAPTDENGEPLGEDAEVKIDFTEE